MSDQLVEGRSPIAPPEPRVLRWLGKFEEALAVFFFCTLIFGVLWQVLGRYLPILNWPGAGEIARYSLMAITFVCVGFLIGNGGQITVSVIDSVVKKERGRRVVRFIAALLLTALCIMLAREAVGLISQGFVRTTAVLQIPMGLLFFLPLFGFVSGAIRSIERLLRFKYPDRDAITLEDVDNAEAVATVKEA